MRRVADSHSTSALLGTPLEGEMHTQASAGPAANLGGSLEWQIRTLGSLRHTLSAEEGLSHTLPSSALEDFRRPSTFYSCTGITWELV